MTVVLFIRILMPYNKEKRSWMKGEIAVRYTIRHFDLPLLTFEANMDSADTDLHIIKVYEENRSFLPLNLTVSEDGVERWLRHRTIPKNRAYVDALLSKVGLSLNRPLGIITVCKGLSLNDCFWVDAEGSGDTFEKVNLYDNRFSQVLAAIAFTGYGSSIRTSLAYDDFFAAAKSAMKPRHRTMLHKLLDFHFDRRATRYNLPPNRLKMIEKEVQRRARVLLG